MRPIDADAFKRVIRDSKYTVPCGDFQQGINACANILSIEIKHFPTLDVVPRKEVEKIKHETAREIFEEISKASADWGCYCITTSKSGFLTEDVNKTLAELKKKYTGEQQSG